MAHRALYRASISLCMLMQACTGDKAPEHLPVFNAANIQVALNNGMLLQGNKPFTGIIYALQVNQKDTAEIVCFNQGREHGIWKKFYAGGELAEVRQFDNGKKTGSLKAWWPNGKQKLDYQFDNGEYQGQCREWQEDGRLVVQMNYDKGYEQGHQLQYYADGKVKANYIIANGRRFGLLGTKNCKNVTDSVFKK